MFVLKSGAQPSHNGVIYDGDAVQTAVPAPTVGDLPRSRDGRVLTPEEVVTQAYEEGRDTDLARAILALYRAALLADSGGLCLLPHVAAKGPRSLREERARRSKWGVCSLVWIHNQATAKGVAPKGKYSTQYGPCWVRDDRIMSADHPQNWVIFRTRESYHLARLAGCVARVFFGGWPAHQTLPAAVREYNNLFPKGPSGWSVALPEIRAGRPLEVVEL